MNQLALLTQFEQDALDAPLGEEGAQLLEQLERVTKLCTELKEFYKAQLAKDPGCIPGWMLKPGVMRRGLANPQQVWEKLQDTLTTEQFLCAVKVEVGKLQDIWAQTRGIPVTRARAPFDQLMGELLITLQNSPSLARTKPL